MCTAVQAQQQWLLTARAVRKTSASRRTAGKVVVLDVGGVMFKLGWNVEKWTPVQGAASGVLTLVHELHMKVVFVSKAVWSSQKMRVQQELRELLAAVDYQLRFVANGKDKGLMCQNANAAWIVDDSARPSALELLHVQSACSSAQHMQLRVTWLSCSWPT